ncbi:MAG: SDR family NAD(P)-dependent oxidoreductase [Bacteroidetes bacterium]|nr:SDR family NAD(P)-dependent oxidoreductase [Bacteroidota bacterium]
MMEKAIVIGASSGIGRGLAKILVANNYKVGITGRRLNLLEDLKKENPDSYYIRSFDINDFNTDIENIETLCNEIGGLDLLIISSGFSEGSENLDYNIEKQTIDTNINSFALIVDWAFNFFKQQNKGHLVVISSVAGLRGNRHSPAYSASKAFQIIYVEGLRHKAKSLSLSITITDIRPGFINTDMALAGKKFWMSSIENAAKQIFNSIKKKQNVAYVTKRWLIVALVLKLMPRAIIDKF